MASPFCRSDRMLEAGSTSAEPKETAARVRGDQRLPQERLLVDAASCSPAMPPTLLSAVGSPSRSPSTASSHPARATAAPPAASSSSQAGFPTQSLLPQGCEIETVVCYARPPSQAAPAPFAGRARFCGNCGAPFVSSAIKFCTHCGQQREG
jgi:hypothetical protein